MKTKQLGNSDLHITPIGFGAWAIGGAGWEFGWGDQDDKASVAAIHRALELGVNWIDTAAVYGMGHSEEVVAAAVKSWSGPRPNVFTNAVANIGPGESVLIQIEYQEPVRQSGDQFSLRVPLVVAPRYEPRPLVHTVDLLPGGQGWGTVAPAPADADFTLYVRAYWPKTPVLDGSWTPPGVAKVEQWVDAPLAQPIPV